MEEVSKMGDMTVDELKNRKLWFLWSAKPAKNGKVTKIPFAANGGATGTDDAHKDTWVSFDEEKMYWIKAGMPVRVLAVCRILQPERLWLRLKRNLILERLQQSLGHIGFDDTEEELKCMEDFRKAQTEIEKKNEKPMSQKMFKAI